MSLTICEDGHDEICYDGHIHTFCPVCDIKEDLLESINDLQEQIRDLEANETD